jgi:hypothetical protein
MESAKDNARVTAYHISVYVALIHYKHSLGVQDDFTVFSREVLPFAKLSRPGTYHQIMRDLAELGYIGYVPSHSPIVGSLVRIVKPAFL